MILMVWATMEQRLREISMILMVWATMEQRLYQRKIHDIDELREQLTATWHNLEQSTIDLAIDQWCKG